MIYGMFISVLVVGSLIWISAVRMAQVNLTAQDSCSYFVLLSKSFELFGDAEEHEMIFRVECDCERTEYFDAKDLVRV
jgi:hypothetical protein